MHLHRLLCYFSSAIRSCGELFAGSCRHPVQRQTLKNVTVNLQRDWLLGREAGQEDENEEERREG